MPRKRKLPDGMWDRDGVYYARFRAGGRFVRKRLSTDFDAACTLLNELRARADKADFGLVDNNYPWDDLKKEFLRWAKQSCRSYKNYEQDIAAFEQYVTVRSVSQITLEMMYGFRESRLTTLRKNGKSVTPRTVNRQVGTIHRMMVKGVDFRRIGFNPLDGIKPLAHDSIAKSRRALTVDEVTSLFEASPEYLKPVWRMFMTTGIRRRELVELHFDDVDFERHVLTVRAANAKNRKPREIPLDAGVLAEIVALKAAAKNRKPVDGVTPEATLRQHRNLSHDHVFVTKANTPWRNNLLKRFYAICKKAGIEGAQRGGEVDIHSLRVTFATLSIEHGANPKAVQAILGHSTLALTMSIYTKATERAKRDAVSALPFATASTPQHVVAMPKAV